jgi:hypothetical protein
MGNGTDPRSAEAPAERRGIDRRTLIKGAAVVTAVGWTAPIIVDSLTSPAAALSAGCHELRVNKNCATDCEDTKCTGLEPCGCTKDTSCLNGIPATCTGVNVTVTYSINTTACPNCTFTAALAHTDAGVCVNPSPCAPTTGNCPPGTTTITFPALTQVPNPDHYDQTILNITCV